MEEEEAICSPGFPESPSGLTPTTPIRKYLSEDTDYSSFSDSDADLVDVLHTFSCKLFLSKHTVFIFENELILGDWSPNLLVYIVPMNGSDNCQAANCHSLH